MYVPILGKSQHFVFPDDGASKRVQENNDDIGAKRKGTRKWGWLGCTLNPYYEGNPTSSMINDERFIFHTIKTDQNQNGWIFGTDSTGDMLKRSNIEHLVGT